ncbi:hypothetical protein K4K59_011005 [Colletotrichum sp. SAR11_240]|nr:hypothetical protein K4K59_011005 [Colletotrichum sp. SAR11_240]
MSNRATPPPRGVLVPAPTFFKSGGELDLETQCTHAVYLAKSGIKGSVVLGSTGEGVHVHRRERIEIIRAVRERLNVEGFNDFLVIAGTCEHNIEETVQQLHDAKKAGAACGQSLVPGYNAADTTDDGLVSWYTAVADKSPIPIIIYNFPGVANGLRIKANGLSRLAQHPNIVGAKLSHGDVSLITQVTWNPQVNHEQFHLYTGLAQILTPFVFLGGAGAVDGTAGYFPKTLIRLFTLASKAHLSDSEVAERKKIQYRVSCMAEFVVKHGVPGIKEATSRLRGLGQIGGTRLPLLGGIIGGDAEWAKWEETFNVVEEIEKSL